MTAHPDKSLLALGVRQPWVELILRGEKTVEVRSSNTRQRGTIYLYSSKKWAEQAAADVAAKRCGIDVDAVPYGVLVGTVDIVGSRPCDPSDATAACLTEDLVAGKFAWELANPVRLESPLEVRFLPYGVWFYPFRRRGTDRRTRETGRDASRRSR